MNTKSRYEVISDLQQKKREYIIERDGLNDTLVAKQNQLKQKERQKSDTVLVIDREIEDMKADIKNFTESIDERKVTIDTLIKSVDEALSNFGKQSSQ